MRQLIYGKLSSSNMGSGFFCTVMPDDEASLGICAKPISEGAYPTTADLVAYVSNFGLTLEVAKLLEEGICVATIMDESASRMGF